MAPPPEDVYCTLLLNDAYLPGALVLAHSLRDGGAKYRLAIMVTLGGVSEASVTELKKLYDYVIPVDPIYSQSAANLHLMRRLDLHAALTKINLWKLTQFRKIVYVDADMVALRAPDELFDVDADFAAAPDAGWPDCFNSGLMVLKPSTDTFDQLTKLASQGESFDGADQGLLNQHFPNWHRLSFVYNCTIGASVGYQYAPAFKHYGANVSMVHFIGATKPWDRGNVPGLSSSNEPYDKLSGHWWEVYNKHQASSKSSDQSWASKGVSGDYQTKTADSSSVGGKAAGSSTEAASGPVVSQAPVESSKNPAANTEVAREPPIRSIDQPSRSQENFTHSHYEKFKADGKLGEFVMTKDGPVAQSKYFQTSTETYHIQEYYPDGKPISENIAAAEEKMAAAKQEPEQFVAGIQHWDPTKSAPPQHGAPEADKLRIVQYQNEWDKPSSAPFVAPTFAPPPKQHLWYEVPGASTQQDAPAKTIFPWESKPRHVTRVFRDVIPPAPQPPVEELVEEEEVFYDSEEGESTTDPTEADETLVGAEEWKNFVSRENKWDTDPAIKDYVLGLRKRRSQASEPPVSPAVLAEVPPITPNPLRQAAPAVVETETEQEPEWDPEAKLEELRRLPPSLLSQLISKMQSSNAPMDDDRGRGRKVIMTQHPGSPTYSDSSTQTDPSSVEDKGVQCACDEEYGEGLPPAHVQPNFEITTQSVTPKASMRFPAAYEDADVKLKEISGLPVDAARARSIDSALGSAIDD
ncbi:nucleotide-diphospho-sugar transferase [Sphaerosporella brunnea]|uniref:glycogenin glucosyltransferase n=1 Tax=Sphaerosporella brunnea TaxID=1250544 RepID=A0A5J5EWQ2_9PEZI|nr:nucleotide-diphospho-sugar transferase [Sphaerosporella brunnea]